MAKVNSKYQITIPPQIRKSLGIVPGTEVDLIRQGDQFVLVANSLVRLKIKWRGKYRGRQSTDEYVETIRGPFSNGP
jgi:AbrB family looped-hinge helix DNA binding protein